MSTATDKRVDEIEDRLAAIERLLEDEFPNHTVATVREALGKYREWSRDSRVRLRDPAADIGAEEGQ